MSGKVYKKIRAIVAAAVGAKDRANFMQMLREPASMQKGVCHANPTRVKYRQFKKIFFSNKELNNGNATSEKSYT